MIPIVLAEPEGTLDLVEAGATQELDNLLNAFSEESDEATGKAADADDEQTIEKELTATQHLDNLLGEFTDDDDVMFAGDEELITPLATSDDADVSTQVSDDDDEVFGATQHLGVLMGEFAGNEEETGELEGSDTAAGESVESQKPEIDHGATQQLDHLLGEFLTDDESAVSDNEFEGLSFDKPAAQEEIDEIEVDHCATQELDHLLSSFADDDEDEESKKD